MQQEYILVFIIALLVFQRLIIVIHEFGHAIATLFNSDGNVTVYIGSYGNPEKSFRFQIKRMECFIKYNVFTWKGGLCVPHGKNTTWKNNVFITLFGPLTTFFMGSISGLIVLFLENNNATKMILFAFTFTCILDFIYNLIPRKTQIQLHDGTSINNDGKRLLYLWRMRTIYMLNIEATTHYNAKEYTKSAELFEECLTKVTDNRELYQLTISSYLQVKNHERAAEIQEVYSKNYKDDFNFIDYVNLGVIHIYKENLDKALNSFKKAQTFEAKNKFVLYNIGFTYGLLGRYEEAITYSDQVISMDPNFQYAWDNRGFSKLKLGQLSAGLLDVEMALELDDKNAYSYRNLGLYYFYKKEYRKALNLYEKALEMDAMMYKIQEYIDEVKVKLVQ